MLGRLRRSGRPSTHLISRLFLLKTRRQRILLISSSCANATVFRYPHRVQGISRPTSGRSGSNGNDTASSVPTRFFIRIPSSNLFPRRQYQLFLKIG